MANARVLAAASGPRSTLRQRGGGSGNTARRGPERLDDGGAQFLGAAILFFRTTPEHGAHRLPKFRWESVAREGRLDVPLRPEFTKANRQKKLRDATGVRKHWRLGRRRRGRVAVPNRRMGRGPAMLSVLRRPSVHRDPRGRSVP